MRGTRTSTRAVLIAGLALALLVGAGTPAALAARPDAAAARLAPLANADQRMFGDYYYYYYVEALGRYEKTIGPTSALTTQP